MSKGCGMTNPIIDGNSLGIEICGIDWKCDECKKAEEKL